MERRPEPAARIRSCLQRDEKFMRAPRPREFGRATLAPSSGFQEIAMTKFTTLAAASILALSGAAAVAQNAAPTQGQPQGQQGQSQGDTARRPRFNRAD